LRRSTAAIAVCLLGAMALTSCAATSPPIPTPTPTSTAIFASEDEALAAATDVFAAYLAGYDSAMAEGGKDLSIVRDYVGDEYFTELSEPGTIVKNNWHTSGASSFEVKEVATFDQVSDSSTINLNLCRDITGIRVLDSNNRDVTPPDREMRIPLAVSFATTSDVEESDALIIVGVKSWLAPDAC
jgi:hypothetical protein